MNRLRILWLTDTHFNNLFPWQRYSFMAKLRKEKPDAIFHTGDISNGIFLKRDLAMLASLNIPIFYIMGNHEKFWSSLEATKEKVRQLHLQYPNLYWLEDFEPIGLGDDDNEVCVIGADGWYDVAFGDPKWIKFTFDWFMIKEFRQLSSMKERIEMFRSLADESCRQIEEKLVKALDQNYKTIYLLTHMPAWKEATRDEGTMFEKFWLPYNTNIRLGKTIEKIMEGRKKRQCHILAGHIHPHNGLYIRVSRNIDCQVGEGHYLGVPHSQKIYI